MNKFDIKLGSAVAIATFVATVVAPIGLADTTVDVSGNGVKSDNYVSVNNTNGVTVNQTNNSKVTNSITVKQNTGGNKASGNTGGDTTVTTGNTTSNVEIFVGGSTNDAVSEGCNTCAANTTVNVTDNGKKTDNTVKVNNGNKKVVNQKNNNTVVNTGKIKQNTGKNKAKNNTNGTTNVTTGHSNSNVTVNVTGASNLNAL